MRVSRCLPILLSLAIPLCGDWHSYKSEGWAWYEDPSALEERSHQHLSADSPSQQIAEARESLENKLSQALLEPTEENVLTYMREQDLWMEKSALFSNTWLRVLLQHPTLDPTAFSRPTSHYGLQIYKQQQQEMREERIREVAQHYGLFFFYEGENSASHTFATLVHELVKKYDWQVVAISVDGTQVSGFESNRLDNGISQAFGAAIYPALYAVDPKTEEAIPLAFGLASLDQIEEKILLQFTLPEAPPEKPQEKYHE